LQRAFSALQLKEGVLAGDFRSLARAATLIEAQTREGQELVSSLFQHTGRAMVLGITGPPGAGKSTLVNLLTGLFRQRGQTVAIIAVDPSSPFSKGAILGDRIRMTGHHNDSGVFIRSVATRGKLGGLARASLEMSLLFDAAGRDVIIIETVGVGQEEVDIAQLADVTALVLVPGLGDDVQVMKAGIMEIADVFVVNKADLPGSEQLEQMLRSMQSLGNAVSGRSVVPIHRVVATTGSGAVELLSAFDNMFRENGARRSQVDVWSSRLRELLRDSLLAKLSKDQLREQAELVAQKNLDPYRALTNLESSLLEGVKEPDEL
jgi:LAO/AO transport system kinase